MTAPWIEAVAAIVAGTPKLPGALCRNRSELFDAVESRAAHSAAELCGCCPDLEPCAGSANRLAHNEAHGVIAGQRRQWVSHVSLVRKPACPGEEDA